MLCKKVTGKSMNVIHFRVYVTCPILFPFSAMASFLRWLQVSDVSFLSRYTFYDIDDLTSYRKHGIETNQTDNLENHRSQTPFSSAKTDVLHQNFALHVESHIALQKYRKLHSVARIWDICTPY